jgi:hypothetical protein
MEHGTEIDFSVFLRLGAENLSMRGTEEKTETHSWGDRVGERPFL